MLLEYMFKNVEIALELDNEKGCKNFDVHERKSPDCTEEMVRNTDIKGTFGEGSEVKTTVERASVVLQNTCSIMNRMLIEI